MKGSLYRVEKGDSLWRIAHIHGTDVEEVQRANPQLDINHISVGDRIFLPRVDQVKRVPKQKLDVERWVPINKELQSAKVQSRKNFSQPIHLSFLWPYHGLVIFPFGMRNQKMHNGIDIQLPSKQPILSAAGGKVVYVGENIEGYDRIIIMLHENKIFTIYAFVGEFLVTEGMYVQEGKPIAKARAMSPKSFFHFEIRHIKTSLDPMKHLR